MRVIRINENTSAIMRRWHNVLRLYPENEIERLSGWCTRKISYVKVKKKPGYKNPLVYNGMLCYFREKERVTSVLCIRLCGLMNLPELLFHWLSIFAFLVMIKPEQFTIGQISWIASVITVIIMCTTAIYSRFSSVGKHEISLIDTFIDQVLSEKEKTE